MASGGSVQRRVKCDFIPRRRNSAGEKFVLAILEVLYYTMEASCRCDGMVDVVDSKSTAGDSVPVRVRSPAPYRVFITDLTVVDTRFLFALMYEQVVCLLFWCFRMKCTKTMVFSISFRLFLVGCQGCHPGQAGLLQQIRCLLQHRTTLTCFVEQDIITEKGGE